jgi:catechol-2,3-dioxygenase
MTQDLKKYTRRDGSTLVKEFRYILLVRNLASLRSFYDEIFDWPITNQWDRGVMYDTGAATLELIQDDEADKPNEASHIAISTSDVWSMFEKLKDKVKIVFPLRDNSWGDTSFQIQDPDGFIITFFTPTK